MEFEKSLKTAIQECGAHIYEIKTRKQDNITIYTIFIFNEEGITIDKCSEVSRAISPIFDVYEPISGKYSFEVSSPGIERTLKTLSNFKCSIGEYIKLKTKESLKLQGILEKIDDDIIYLKYNDEKVNIAFDDILKAQTYIKW